MKPHVLVTGGAGYIGGVVAAQLLEQGHPVTILDNLSHGRTESIPRGAKFVRGDVGDRAILDGIFRENSMDAVMHFAAFIEAGESMQVPEKYFRNNTANALTLLEAMLAHKISRFVFSSTAAVYGMPERTPIEETSTLVPTNAYGQSKLLVEQMLSWFHRIHGLRYACLRYFNAAGAAGDQGEDHHPETHLIPIALQVALGQREHISVYGTDYPTSDGTCVRDYIHVSDIAAAHILVLEALNAAEALTYNIGNGNGFSVLEVIECARQVTGHPIPAVLTPRRPGDSAVLVAGSEKISRELHWRARYPDLKSIVRSAWEWRRAHPEGYAPSATGNRSIA